MRWKHRDYFGEAAQKVGEFLTDHPWKFITISSAITLALASGLLRIRLETDIRSSFSPKHSDTARETDAYLDFYNLTVFPQRAFLHFSAVDGGDMLRPAQLHEVHEMDRRFRDFLDQEGADGNKMCDPICNMNAPFHYFVNELEKERSGEKGTRIFAHPSSTFGGQELFLATSLFGVKQNDTSTSSMRISSVESIVMWYFARADTPERLESYRNFVLEIFHETTELKGNESVRVDIFGDVIANHEMIRGALEATRMMTLGFVFLVVFVCMVLVRDWPVRQLPILTALTVLTPLMATAAAFGLLAWMGVSVYSIQCVAPFLVLGIGVDDAFILFHWWHAMRGVADQRERSRLVFGQISASITITSLTNIVAFGIGYMTPTPQMSYFCLATSMSLLIDYILTYTILGPSVFLLSSSYTEAPIEISEDEKEPVVVADGLPLQQAPPIVQKTPEKEEQDFLTYSISVYSKFVTSISGQCLCLVVVVALFAYCTFGVLSMTASFEPAKAFPSDSPLATSLQRIKPVFNETFPLNLFVHNPPKISNDVEYSKFKSMISELESIPGVYGRNRTLMFFKEYENFDKSMSAMAHGLRAFMFSDDAPFVYKPSLSSLPTFLDFIGNPITIQYERPPNGTEGEGTLKRFYMAVTASGMSEWARRAEMVDTSRKVINKYPEFKTTLFDGDSAVLHLLLTVGQDLIGSILVTVIAMAVICWFFVWNGHAVVIISAVVTSICYCLVGVLSWWGADLDPVTQVDVLLATGFSVDYTAHIAFQFCRAQGSAKERVRSALDEMSAPLLQAGISTLLCMLPLIFVKTYAILAFAKTVFAVIFLGLLHGLFILPVLLAIYPPKSLSYV